METEFRAFELDATASNLRILLPLLGIVFVAFLIPDYWVLKGEPEFRLSFAARAAFLAATIWASFRMRPDFPLERRERTLTVTAFIGVAVFGMVLYAYRNANFHLQAMSVTLMIVAVYLIPNRFEVSLSASCILAGMGIAYLCLPIPSLTSSERGAYFVDFPLMVALSAYIWRAACRARRREYARTKELECLSMTDFLTGIGNRREFDERLASALARRKRYGEEVGLVLLDLDRFKRINDNQGHQTGDLVLKEITRRLKSSLRAEDSLARWGGEEFIALLYRASAQTTLDSAARLQAAISSTPCANADIVTASFGVTTLRESDTADDALARADRALYRSKKAGGNRVEFEDGTSPR